MKKNSYLLSCLAIAVSSACHAEVLTYPDPLGFIVQLPQILDLLHRLNSPWAEQARQLVDANSTITSALHTLFLQRWRLSLIVQATTLNQQLLEEEREQLLSEVQERMTLSGQLEPILADNNTAAGRLWDMPPARHYPDVCFPSSFLSVLPARYEPDNRE